MTVKTKAFFDRSDNEKNQPEVKAHIQVVANAGIRAAMPRAGNYLTGCERGKTSVNQAGLVYPDWLT